EGVKDEETFPSRVAGLLPRRHVYNLGVPGFGPNDVLHELASGRSPRYQGIREPKGTALYLFIDDHVRRTLGTMRYLAENSYKWGASCWDTPGGELRLLGTFADCRGPLHRLLGRSELLRFFNVDFPPVTEDRLDLIARMFGKMRDLLREKHSVSELHVIIYPGQSQYGPRVAARLRELGISVRDYSAVDLGRSFRGNHTLRGNGHPSALAYRFLADLLVEDLKSRGLERIATTGQ
ncbi:MAG TPA: hypothetical protein VM598_05920, partial [Bdellovibrionota bacterium]|nr:hypothetical protein [Bdellovibrionota bacterium]